MAGNQVKIKLKPEQASTKFLRKFHPVCGMQQDVFSLLVYFFFCVQFFFCFRFCGGGGGGAPGGGGGGE